MLNGARRAVWEIWTGLNMSGLVWLLTRWWDVGRDLHHLLHHKLRLGALLKKATYNQQTKLQ